MAVNPPKGKPMRKLLNKKSGFTLIELMIVVAILGILAAIAIPAFVTYVRRAKTVEATENLSKMFDAVSTYYSRERTGSGLTASMLTSCTVASANDGKADPTDQKQLGTYTGNSWNGTQGIGFQLPGPAYYAYSIVTTTAGCSNAASTEHYQLRATGDLDNDATNSTFEYAVGSNADNELYHAPAFFITNETE
jgi:type IV pilus assembly protein PilA